MHIGDVEGRRGRERARGHAMAAGDDQAVAIEPERFDGQREQRQKGAKTAFDEWGARQPVDERDGHLAARQRWRDRLGIVTEGKHISARKNGAQRFQDVFTAPHRNKPVVNDSDGTQHRD